MKAINNRRASIASSLSNNTAPLVAVGIGICVAVAVGILLTGADPTVGLFLLPALGLVALALWSPYWLVVIGLAQLAFFPIEGNLLGYYIPNVLQFIAPLAFGSVLFQALRRRDNKLLRMQLADILLGALALWGIAGMYFNGIIRLKSYANNVVFAMFWYYAIRLLPLDRNKVQRLLLVLSGAAAIQSALMIHESIASGSPLYGMPSAKEIVGGVAAAMGPFPYNWDAGAYLCLWPSLVIYALACSRSLRGKVMWLVGLVAILGASTRTMERASLAACVLAIVVCLLAPKLRRTAFIVLAVLVVCYIPWSVSSFGGPLIGRFQETDQSRYARRVAAVNLMNSSKWNPLYGIGWKNFRNLSRGHGTGEEITVWGTKTMTVEEVARHSELHNVWYALPVEFGIVGMLMFIGIMAQVGRGVICVLRARRREIGVDTGLVVAILGSMIALGGVGYYHNIYAFEASMCVFWAFVALLTGHHQAFLIAHEDETAEQAHW